MDGDYVKDLYENNKVAMVAFACLCDGSTPYPLQQIELIKYNLVYKGLLRIWETEEEVDADLAKLTEVVGSDEESAWHTEEERSKEKFERIHAFRSQTERAKFKDHAIERMIQYHGKSSFEKKLEKLFHAMAAPEYSGSCAIFVAVAMVELVVETMLDRYTSADEIVQAHVHAWLVEIESGGA